MKKTLFILLSLMATHLHAQDVIIKKDDSTILAKVLEVDETNIKYKKYSNQSGPTYTISIANVRAINYQNGEKEDFGHASATPTTQESSSSARYIQKSADERNAELFSLYNKYYSPTAKLQKAKGSTKYYMLIFGVKSSSIMSNEDIEMTFVRAVAPLAYRHSHVICYINIKNKTDKTIYIDRGNCFRILNDGTFYCYYEPTEQTTVNMGGGHGISLGLGSVAGALGIGGAVGQLAGGISVGSGTSHSVSTTYLQERIISIPPHANRNLTEEKVALIKDGSLLTNHNWKIVEEAEIFNFEELQSSWIANSLVNRGIPINPGLELEEGLVDNGKVLE